MKRKPAISVIICTYNGKRIIDKCLNSILNQKYPHFEVLCIDGGSKDGTISIIRDYQKKDKRIKLLRNKNKFPEGIGNGKWKGFKRSKGNIIGMIDQDNVLQRTDIFSEIIQIFKKNNKTD